MEDTLQINVFESISVSDVVKDAIKKIGELVKRVWGFMFSEEEKEAPQKENDANRAPPALGVNVAEEIKMNESLR